MNIDVVSTYYVCPKTTGGHAIAPPRYVEC